MEVDELPKNWPSELISLHYEKKVTKLFCLKGSKHLCGCER
jgi:hypothetical protein